MRNAGYIWWDQLISAKSFISSILEAINNRKNIVLCLPKKVPWYDVFCDILKSEIAFNNPSKGYQQISCPTEPVDKYFFAKFVRPDDKCKYKVGISIAEFIAKTENCVLHGGCIWVQDIPSNKKDEWLKFISEYSTKINKDWTPATFILETSDESFLQQNQKNLVELRYDSQISDYDKYSFCTMLASETKCKDYLKHYLAEMVSLVCNNDVELCAECVRNSNEFMQNPLTTIQRISRTTIRSDGSSFEQFTDEKVLQSKVWESQIKQVFPAMERIRVWLIEKYADILEERFENYPVYDGFGNELESPYECEIATIDYMVRHNFVLVSDDDKEELVMLSKARNRIAHLKPIAYEEVEKILSKKCR